MSECPNYYWTPLTSDPNKAVCKGNVKQPTDRVSGVLGLLCIIKAMAM